MRDDLIALTAVVAVVGGLRLAGTVANTTTAALGFLLTVLFVARTLSNRSAYVASLAGALALNYFFIPPFHTLSIVDPLNWVAFAAFLVVALTVGELSARAKQQTANANAQRIKAEDLYAKLQAAFDREAQTEAERRNERLKSALLDAVTHNLRTPITSIKASTSALLSPPSGAMNEAITRELLTVADEEADRLDLLVEDLIGIARIEAGQLGLNVGWCSIEDVVASAIKRGTRLLSTHTVRTDVPAEVPVVHADPKSLEEVVFQLLENAAKYSPAGSPILVSAHEQAGEIVEIRVEDEGPGVPVEERDRIFSKFYRAHATEATTAGSGLGLAIVRGIVEAHRGQVFVTDRPGRRGASFVVRLPIGDEEAA